MNPKPLELRKWFNVLVALLGIATAVICLLVVRSSLPAAALSAHIALTLLFVGAMGGFVTVLRLFLPFLVVKIWPSIEEPHSGK